MGFKSTENKGFVMTFANGWTISVQFGYGNYCDNRNHPNGFGFSQKQEITESQDAEIAIWDKDGEWYDFGNDQVKAYQTAEEVAEWINKVASW